MLKITYKEGSRNVKRIGFPATKFSFVLPDMLKSFASDVYLVSDLDEYNRTNKKKDKTEEDLDKLSYLTYGRLSMLHALDEKHIPHIPDYDPLVRFTAIGLKWLKGYGMKEFNAFYEGMKKTLVSCNYNVFAMQEEERNAIKRLMEKFINLYIMQESNYSKPMTVKLRGKDFDFFLRQAVSKDGKKIIDDVQHGKYFLNPEKSVLCSLAYAFLMSFGYEKDESEYWKTSLFDPTYYDGEETNENEQDEQDEQEEQDEDQEPDEQEQDEDQEPDENEQDEQEEIETGLEKDEDEDIRSGLGRDNG